MNPVNQPTRYINLYTEASPNPNSLKFVVNHMLVPEGTDYDFPDAESAQMSPLAAALFAHPFVERVFLMSNFVTVTKKTETEWLEIKDTLKREIKEYLEQDRPVLSPEATAADAINPDDPEVVKKIKGLLDEYVRPAVESDGGAISFHSFQDGVVTLQLRGSCSGCPASTVTLKQGIENLMKRMLPGEVKEVVAQGV